MSAFSTAISMTSTQFDILLINLFALCLHIGLDLGDQILLDFEKYEFDESHRRSSFWYSFLSWETGPRQKLIIKKNNEKCIDFNR